METAMVTLSDFLLARIAEDEAVARAVGVDEWSVSDYREPQRGGNGPQRWIVDSNPTLIAEPREERQQETAEHIARHDPARVLAECEAKRRIVRRCALVIDDDAGRDLYSDGWSGLRVAEYDLRDLASVYADHADYRDEWRP